MVLVLKSGLARSVLCIRRRCPFLNGAVQNNVMKIPRATFYEPDKTGGYDLQGEKLTFKETIKEMNKETAKWAQEVKYKFTKSEPLWSLLEHNDYEIVYRFNDERTIKEWIVTADSDHNEGKSQAKFFLGPNKRGVFCGILNNETPKDGITKNAGYVHIRGPKERKSFKREEPFNWERYTHLIMLVRGDGRPYQITLGMHRHYDVQWFDQYFYPMYTRGGPYWQYVKIPFSKFILSSKGRIQDRQAPIDLNKVLYVGIGMYDGYNGPFELEIDWMGCMYDETHTEGFAYEMYEVGSSDLD